MAQGTAAGHDMIGKKPKRPPEEAVTPKGFDDFDLRLGDIMRGERATMGKSLLDVQRDLRIKANYIAAIENSDPDVFDTPGFIAGYVRSYARYLNMDPDETFQTFCLESGFAVAHGMSAEASVLKKPNREERLHHHRVEGEMFTAPALPFTPTRDGVLSQIEPRAVGSSLVLLALIGAIGFGGYSILQEVQRVQMAPVDQTPSVLADLDPLQSVVDAENDNGTAADDSLRSDVTVPTTLTAPRADALARLYRPQALDVPVLVARDAPIATLDPRMMGNFTDATPQVAGPEPLDEVFAPQVLIAEVTPAPAPNVPQVVEATAPALEMVAVREAWVRVRAADGTVIFEGVMQPGDSWTAPATEEPPIARIGESGAIYFAMDGAFYGPVGKSGAVTSNLPLDVASLQDTYLPVDVNTDTGLVRYAQASGLLPTAD